MAQTTQYRPEQYDAMLRELMETSPNMAIPWFLMASWLYYHADVSLLTDALYDELAAGIDEFWDQLEHRHKVIIDRDSLKAGTLFAVPDEAYPTLLVSSACHLAGIPYPKSDLARSQYL